MTYIELFCTTPVRGKIVSYFARHPKSYVTARSLARDINEDRGGVTRMLRSLLRRHFIESRRENQRLYYRINPDLPFLKELKSLAMEASGQTKGSR